jgi:beta-hydroxylase
MSSLRGRLGRIARGVLPYVYGVAGWLFSFTRHGRAPFYPPYELPWARNLAANWKAIRGELDVIMEDLESLPNVQDSYAGQSELTQDDRWKSFDLVPVGQADRGERPAVPADGEAPR